MKKKWVFSWSLQILLAGILGMAASSKLLDDPESIRLFSALGMEPTGRYLIGGLEVLSALLLLWGGTSGKGALLALCILLGAFLAHATQIGFGGEMMQMSLLWAVALLCSVGVLALRGTQLPFLARAFDR